MSIQIIKLFAEKRASELKPKHDRKKIEYRGIKILDALAATGLRSVRYLKEIPGVKCYHHS